MLELMTWSDKKEKSAGNSTELRHQRDITNKSELVNIARQILTNP